ncbi:MAG: flavodoxin family protein [Methylovirgula sp.]
MTKILVAYFSRLGTTEELAHQLAARLGAEIDTIRLPSSPYAGIVGYWRGIWHALRHRLPDIAWQRDPAGYALLVVGSPVWAGSLSAPVRAYLTRFDGHIGPIAAFWVSGSGRAYPALAREIEDITGHVPLATTSFGRREVLDGATSDKLDALARDIRAHVS